MPTIEFDAGAGNALERAYLTSDVIEQRERVLAALDPRPGEHILDVGPGPGLLMRDLSARVGPEGRVVGADLSEAMIALAQARCANLSNIELDVADASALEYPEASFDAIVSTQVYEYIEDIPGAMARLFEMTRPGGRIAILDTDYDSLVVFTEDRARHERILDAWDDHFVHRDLPRFLGPVLRRVGFELRETSAIPIVNTRWHEDEFSFYLVPMMATFAKGTGKVSKSEAADWLAELKELGEAGRYFYSLNRYLFVADRPSI